MPGGFLGGLANAAGDAYQTAAGVADHAAGSVDESVARATDDEPGGGLVDGAAGTLDHLSGSVDEAIGRQFDDTPGGGLRGGFGEEFQGDDQSFLTRGALGLHSLVDSEPGNTAGPGQQSWETAADAREQGYAGAAAQTFEDAGSQLGGPLGWLVAHPGYVLGGIVVLYALTAAGPALELANTAAGGGGS